jgi:quinol-cytochrome oxidoreductase complex cytochrome b subunit/coenzyme F420-reducing hydrogenase delta subunit
MAAEFDAAPTLMSGTTGTRVSLLKRLARAGFERVESLFDTVFTPDWNPFYQLGALGWFYYWIVVVSGIYLYVFFDPGVTDAYASVERITHVQWYAGGVMRSLHRYASDALVIMMVLHLVREYVMDRMHGPRWFAWVIGVPIIWLVFAAGISGYWVVWDKLAQYIAIASSEWLDALPLFGEPIARNFIHDSALSGRFFTLMVFIHIAVPLVLLFVMWIHIHRHTHARVNPPLGLAIGTLTMLVVLSFVQPALSQGPAVLDAVPAVVGLDWFYLFLYPLLDEYSGIAMWALLGAATLLLLVLPWLPRKHQVAAVVDLDNCNGCERCAVDCPHGAVRMAARSDGSVYLQEAVVDPALCVACGICVGACPTATPFRRRSALKAGIELPEYPVLEIRKQSLSRSKELEGDDRVMVYGCGHGADLRAVAGASVAVVELPCVAMLPPSFIDFLITRHHVDGVFITGCRAGNCYERLGARWMEQRIAGERDPHLRPRVPRERIATFWAGVDAGAALAEELAEFRARLRGLHATKAPATIRRPEAMSHAG